MKSTFYRFTLFFAVLFMLGAYAARAEEPAEVRLFDTVKPTGYGAEPDFATHKSWKQVPEDQTKFDFKGDVVLMNERLAVVLGRNNHHARVYALNAKGAVARASLTPVGFAAPRKLIAVKIVENTPGAVSLIATFDTGSKPMSLNLQLKVGQPAVQLEAGAETNGLSVSAQPCRFAVLPDFFADDMVVDATTINSNSTELPADNFLMHMVDGSIVLAVWDKPQDDIVVNLMGQGKNRVITSSIMLFGKDEKGPGKIFIALLEGKNIWHTREIADNEMDKEIRLDWNAPFPAQYRIDWQTTEKVTDTWEMLTQKADGTYEKHGWYGQAENFGNDTWLKTGRERWTTVLGRFKYPCWIDKGGEGYIRPLVKKALTLQGPIVIYPINRIDSTPLDAFTTMDIMRATLGVGPCEYILDVAGQKKNYTGLPTCETQTALVAIYSAKEQVKKHDEVVKLLTDVIAFVRQIRGRIEAYREFGKQMDAYLESQKKANLQYVNLLNDLQKINHGIEEHYALKTNMKTPEYATGLFEEFRTKVVDNERPDALAQCTKITDSLRFLGADQDELVGECRVQVKILRQRAALAMANDPNFAPIAKEIRKRTQQMLRNPLSYEAPRH